MRDTIIDKLYRLLISVTIHTVGLILMQLKLNIISNTSLKNTYAIKVKH